MRKLLIGAAIGAILAAGTTAAVASIPSLDGTLHGCRDVKTGALRVIDIDAGASCSKSEAALSWNQTGPQGPAGPPSVSGVHVIEDTAQGRFRFQVACPAGETALSGAMDGFTEGLYRTNWHPVTDANSRPIAYEFSSGDTQMHVYVTCATTS
jgi:hypothetical protein